MMTTAEYWRCLPPFDYVTTYSFNRGPKLLRLAQAAEQRRQLLRSQLLQLSGPALQAQREELRRCETYALDLELAPLTNGPNVWHLTASPVATLTATDLAEVGNWLQHPVGELFAWMCAPVYRDALVFHAADGHVLSVLNICFQCERLLTEAKEEVQADAAVYRGLKMLLQGLGHPIPDGYEGLDLRQ